MSFIKLFEEFVQKKESDPSRSGVVNEELDDEDDDGGVSISYLSIAFIALIIFHNKEHV